RAWGRRTTRPSGGRARRCRGARSRSAASARGLPLRGANPDRGANTALARLLGLEVPARGAARLPLRPTGPKANSAMNGYLGESPCLLRPALDPRPISRACAPTRLRPPAYLAAAAPRFAVRSSER